MSHPERLDFARIEALIRAQMSPVTPEGGPVSREDTALFVLLALTQEVQAIRDEVRAEKSPEARALAAKEMRRINEAEDRRSGRR